MRPLGPFGPVPARRRSGPRRGRGSAARSPFQCVQHPRHRLPIGTASAPWPNAATASSNVIAVPSPASRPQKPAARRLAVRHVRRARRRAQRAAQHVAPGVAGSDPGALERGDPGRRSSRPAAVARACGRLGQQARRGAGCPPAAAPPPASPGAGQAAAARRRSVVASPPSSSTAQAACSMASASSPSPPPGGPAQERRASGCGRRRTARCPARWRQGSQVGREGPAAGAALQPPRRVERVGSPGRPSRSGEPSGGGARNGGGAGVPHRAQADMRRASTRAPAPGPPGSEPARRRRNPGAAPPRHTRARPSAGTAPAPPPRRR